MWGALCGDCIWARDFSRHAPLSRLPLSNRFSCSSLFAARRLALPYVFCPSPSQKIPEENAFFVGRASDESSTYHLRPQALRPPRPAHRTAMNTSRSACECDDPSCRTDVQQRPCCATVAARRPVARRSSAQPEPGGYRIPAVARFERWSCRNHTKDTVLERHD